MTQSSTRAASTAPRDPRVSMSTTTAGIDRVGPIAAPQYLDFSDPTADTTSPVDAGSVWTARGQNALVHYVAVERPGTAIRTEAVHEVVLVAVGEDSAAVVTWNGEEARLPGQGVAIIPPGTIEIHASGQGDLALLLRADEDGWKGEAVNDDAYATPAPRVAPADPWPAPVGAEGVRVHLVADHPAEEGRFGWIFRSRSFMVNFVPPHDGPRDPHQLSPHHHDDFEQYSLAVQGEFVHHIRTPWTKDQTTWRKDDHVLIGSPSLTLIPPPTVHTSAGSGPGRNQLVDIFSPPRVDFSEQPGWVLNADEHPAP